MYEVTLLDRTTEKRFKKNFDSEYFLNKFLKKVKYSKKLIVVSVFKN